MYRQNVFALLVAGLAILTLPEARGADAVADSLAGYRVQGADAFDADAGGERWRQTFPAPVTGEQISCASCHSENLRQPGRHMRTLKAIEPMSPAVNAARLTDVKKIEKWFLRNCKGTWGRECTPQEKGDFLLYIQSQ